MQSSPDSSGPRLVPVSGSMTFPSVDGTSGPTDADLAVASWLNVPRGESSLIPHACLTLVPSRASAALSASSPRGAAALTIHSRLDMS